MTKIKINNQLYKLRILKLLELQHGILDTTKTIDLEELAGRLSCDKDLLLEVLIDMDIDILEE